MTKRPFDALFPLSDTFQVGVYLDSVRRGESRALALHHNNAANQTGIASAFVAKGDSHLWTSWQMRFLTQGSSEGQYRNSLIRARIAPMAAMQRQLIISLEDLRYVSVECPTCNSILTLDMLAQSEHQKKQGLFVPGLCSVCQKGLDSALRHVAEFQRAYIALLPIAGSITFKGKVEPL